MLPNLQRGFIFSIVRSSLNVWDSLLGKKSAYKAFASVFPHLVSYFLENVEVLSSIRIYFGFEC